MKRGGGGVHECQAYCNKLKQIQWLFYGTVPAIQHNSISLSINEGINK